MLHQAKIIFFFPTSTSIHKLILFYPALCLVMGFISFSTPIYACMQYFFLLPTFLLPSMANFGFAPPSTTLNHYFFTTPLYTCSRRHEVFLDLPCTCGLFNTILYVPPPLRKLPRKASRTNTLSYNFLASYICVART